MAIRLGSNSIGNAQGDAGGATPDISFNTTVDIPAASLLIITVFINSGGNTNTVGQVNGGGYSFARRSTGQDVNSSQATAKYDLLVPATITSGTTITAQITGNFFDWIITGVYYVSDWGIIQMVRDATTVQQTSGTAWATANQTITQRGMVHTIVGARVSTSNTPDSPGVEDMDLAGTGGQPMVVINQRRIEDPGTYTNSGTFNVATDGSRQSNTLYYERQAPTTIPNGNYPKPKRRTEYAGHPNRNWA